MVVGTAGHIDHGKSALVKALTGIDPDRLEEEQRRGMTIDLGFAHLDLPGGRRVGIVDVPGHERLIKNMLAGAGGIDLVLFVVAADEGVMPQTREHLDILRFLRPRDGVIALTKIDLVDDPDWLALVQEEIRGLATGTFLAQAAIVPVSARTGVGLDDLVREIERRLQGLPPRQADGPVRLPVDRVFTMAGFGTVITGTLWSGRIRAGDVLEVLPHGHQVRVRQVQRHGRRVEEVAAGSRTALNLVGVDRAALDRGMVLATPGTFQAATLLDARLRSLPGTPPLPHLARLRLYLGTAEVLCRLALLDRDRLAPGEEALVQLRLDRPLVAARGDAFVVRRSSPLMTIGGGEVITVNPPRRRRGEVETLTDLLTADLRQLVRSAITRTGLKGTTVEGLAPLVSQRVERIEAEVAGLMAAGEVLQIRDRVFDAGVVDQATRRLITAVEEQHRTAPWRMGLPREEAKTRAFPGADDRLAAATLEQLTDTGRLHLSRGFLHLPGHRPAFTPDEGPARERILAAIERGGYAPPAVEEVSRAFADAALAARMVQSLVEAGELVEVSPGIVFAGRTLERIKDMVTARIGEAGEMTVAQLRDALGTSRRYALALMEYFDGIHLTRRVGDRRVLAGSRPSGARPPVS